MNIKVPFILLIMSVAAMPAEDFVLHTFKKIQITDQFYCEGIYYGDVNRDGNMDVVSGPFWHEGPEFNKKHEFRPAKAYDPMSYSDNFITFVWDFNQDKWPDILIIDMPGLPGCWYENPKGKTGHWQKHVAFPVVDNESPNFGDLTGDGKPELIFNTGGCLGYAEPDWSNPTKPWQFHAISPKGKWHKYTHGLGFGDINGDGRTDYIEIGGWWEQPASLENDVVWELNAGNFGEGAAQMLVYDVNGDGLNDIITCLNPHTYGLAWFEQVKTDGQRSFRKHLIMGDKPQDNKYGVKFTQIHAFALVDMDNDGLKDFVTGKRFWAHPPPTDPESNAPAVLYWFKLARSQDGKQVEFIPCLIDDDSGVGTQVVAADVNGDKLPDVLVGNKKGTFVFIHQTKTATKTEWEKAQPKPYQAQ